MGLNIYRIHILIVLFFCSQMAALNTYANTQICQQIYSAKLSEIDQRASGNVLKFQDNFTHEGHINRYRKVFPWLQSSIDRVAQLKQGHWIDSGGGNGQALQFVLSEHPTMTSSLISLQTSASPGPRLKIYQGRYIEQIPHQEFAPADLITDVMGPMAYSSRPDLVLTKYFDVLKTDGEILLYLGTFEEIYGRQNLIITENGKVISLLEWIGQIQGINVEVFSVINKGEFFDYEILSVRITKTASEIIVPTLKLVTIKEGAPPKMIFQEDSEKQKSILSAKILSQIQGIIKQNFFSEFHRKLKGESVATKFFDSFRGGEIVNPFVSKLSQLSNNETWVNISPLSTAIKTSLQKNQLRYRSNQEHSMLSQMLMWLRSRFINNENNNYVSLNSAQNLEKLAPAKIITDYGGDFLTSLHPDQVLYNYLKQIDIHGTVIVYLGAEDLGFAASSFVINRQGQRLSLREWLQSISGPNSGFNMKYYRSGYAWTGGELTFATFTRDPHKIVKVPKLQLLGAIMTEGKLHGSLVFQEQ